MRVKFVCIDPDDNLILTYTDVDECLEAVANQRDICPANTVCINTIGSFQCVCVPGYELVDGTCRRKFE